MSLNLGLMALAPLSWMLYPVVGILAVGAGLAIPSVTALISHRVSGGSQGKVMGGVQALLSLTLILGPLIAGGAFDYLGVPAPYWSGASSRPPLSSPHPELCLLRAKLQAILYRTNSPNQERKLMSSPRTTDAALTTGIVLLTLATAVIHLQLNFPDPVFILNGLGYLALLAALYVPVPRLAGYRNAARWTLVGYTALTILLWVLFGARTPIGYADKLIEVLLIILLLVDARRSR